MGAVRSAAQMISYEISLGFVVMGVCLCSGSLSVADISSSQATISVWFALPLAPLFVIFFVSILAETNRAPFDLPEAEAELVSGYNTEYSSTTFALFFLGEYANMLLMSSLWVSLFLGGWGFFGFLPNELGFGLKVVFAAYLFVLVRAILPRYRYDKLLALGWRSFLPLTLGFLIFLLGVLSFFGGLPYPFEVATSPDAFARMFLV